MAKLNLDIRKLDAAASRLRSIAHPTRITIIHMLESIENMNVTSIYKRLKIEQASASHHLHILKSNGMLESRRAGKNTLYSLRPQALNALLECIKKCT